MTFSEDAFAKVNLYLHVVGRKDNGYHELDSLVVFAQTGDVVQAAPSEKLELSIDGPFASNIPADETNLVMKAATVLQEQYNIVQGVKLVLDKRLPAAAGIGGGSSDAAATLRLLMRFWNIQADETEVIDLALKLGADVPVCYKSKNQIMRGVGERLLDCPELPETYIVLVNPGIALSTPEVFKAKPFAFKAERKFGTVENFEAFILELKSFDNDLFAGANHLAPEIAIVLSIIKEQPGCALSRMSGSGSTCFGLFKHKREADEACKEIAKRHPDWWVSAAPMIS